MKKLLAFLGGLLLSTSLTFGFDCTTDGAASDCSVSVCDFDTASTWTLCNSTFPQAGDSWTVAVGDRVLYDTTALVVGRGIINGELLFDEGSGSRDATTDLRSLHIRAVAGNPEITINATGRLTLRKSDRIRFDTLTNTTAASIAINNGGVFDAHGSIHKTEIGAVTAADEDAPTCGGTTGRKYTITPKTGIDLVKVGRRVVFETGALRTYHLEIVSVSSPSFVVCTNLTDGTSNGQRLTRFTTPGTYPGAGTAGKHSVPVPVAGTTDFDPVIGNAITLIDDVWIDQFSGTLGWEFNEEGGGIDPLPIIKAVNFATLGVSSGTALTITPRTLTQTVPDFEYNNLHGWLGTFGVVWRGASNFRIHHNAAHDHIAAAGTEDTTCFLQVHQQKTGEGSLLDTFAHDVIIDENIGWGFKQCVIQVNDASNSTGETVADFRAQDISVRSNRIFEGCVSNQACHAIEIYSCLNCDVTGNMLFDIINNTSNGGNGVLASGSADNDGSSVSHNYIVNLGRSGFVSADVTGGGVINNDTNTQEMGITHNYVSHVRDGGQGANWYGNLIKNVGINNVNGHGLKNPISTLSNIIIPVEDAVAAAANCTGAANECGRVGIAFTSSAEGNTNQQTVTVTDLVVGRFRNAAGGSNKWAIYTSDAPGNPSADFGGTISHVTHDNRATDGNGYARLFEVNNASPPSPALTWTIDDSLTGYTSNDQAIICTATASITETMGTIYSTARTIASAVRGGGVTTTPGDCSTAPTYVRPPSLQVVDRDALNFNLSPGSVMIDAGLSPANSAVGIRAWRFDRGYFERQWGANLPFDNQIPANIDNTNAAADGVSDNRDTDGDGVIDLHDNCDTVWNPSQTAASAC